MGHREQAQFDRAEWKLGALIPAWIVQITLMLGLMGLFAYRLTDTIENWNDEIHTFKVPVVLLVWECTNVGLNLLALILTFVEIGKHAAETLTPFSMLFTQAIKLTCGFANLALDIVVHVQFPQGHWSIIGVAIGSGLVAAGLFPLLYTILVYRRVSAFDEYSSPANTKHFGFGAQDTSYPSQSGAHNNSNLEAGTYHDRPESKRYSTASSTFSVSTLKTSLGSGRSRGESIVSNSEAGLGDGRNRSQTSIPLDVLGVKRTSYNHERDTQFDDFLRRHSTGGTDPGSVGGDGSAAKVGRPRGGSNKSISHEAQLITVPERVEEEEGFEVSVLPEHKTVVTIVDDPDKQGLLAAHELVGERDGSPKRS